MIIIKQKHNVTPKFSRSKRWRRYHRDVESAFDRRSLKRRCHQSIDDLFGELSLMGGKLIGKKGQQHAYLDRGKKLLSVAHLDHVQQVKGWGVVKVGGDEFIFNPRLDDRLGVYTILDLLPKLGIQMDILFTENEEVGQSTAFDFKCDKKYNWIVEFDRRGESAVTYGFSDGGWRSKVDSYFTHESGSFSDICILDDIGCKALNVGVSYHSEHSNLAHMEVGGYIRQIARFMAFYYRYSRKRFVHKKPRLIDSPYRDGNHVDTCDWCYKPNKRVFSYLYDDKVRLQVSSRRICETCLRKHSLIICNSCWRTDYKSFSRVVNNVRVCYDCSQEKRGKRVGRQRGKRGQGLLDLPKPQIERKPKVHVRCHGCSEYVPSETIIVAYDMKLCKSCAAFVVQ